MHFRYLPDETQSHSFNGFHFEVCVCAQLGVTQEVKVRMFVFFWLFWSNPCYDVTRQISQNPPEI